MKLEAKDIEAVLGGNAILRGVSLEVKPNEFVGIIGPNGSGKSTLLKCIYRVLKPQAGIVKLDGTDIRELSYKKSAQSIAVLAQHNYYNFEFSVQDVVLMGRSPHKRAMERDNAQDYAIVAQALETVGMADMAKRSFSTLSGGEQQRVILARALAQQTPCLILDEPTNHLDIYTRENLTEALMAYTGTLLMVTHDRHLMNSLGCPILYLEDGKATLYPSYDALMGRAAPAAAPEKAGDQPAKAGYGKEQRRRRAELRAKIKACEDEMEACGAREVELDNEINSPEVYNDPDLLRQKSDELSDLRFHQEELFAAWEKAMEEQEQYEQAADEE